MKRSFVLFVILATLAGCKGKPASIELNQAIAADYLEFYEKGVSQPTEAMAALDRAESADPQNAYTQYLKASAYAKVGDLTKALDVIVKANQMEKVLVYVSAPPPEDPIQSLNRIRQLGFTTAKADLLGAEQEKYFVAVREMGARVARAEPVNSLGVLNGAGVVRKSYQSEIDYWKKKNDLTKAKKVEAALRWFGEWYEQLNHRLSDTVRDLMRDSGKAAGLTDQELADYSNGIELKDKAKQQKADEARAKMYADEIAALRKSLATMPDVGPVSGS